MFTDEEIEEVLSEEQIWKDIIEDEDRERVLREEGDKIDLSDGEISEGYITQKIYINERGG